MNILKLSLAALSFATVVLATPRAQACGGGPGYGQEFVMPVVRERVEQEAVRRHFAARQLGRIVELNTISSTDARAFVSVSYLANGSSRVRNRIYVVRLRNAEWTVTGSARAV